MPRTKRFWSSDEDVLCPVGGHTRIGERHGLEAVILTCDECDFDFHYKQGELVPVAIQHKKFRGCACDLCSYRDLRKKPT